MPGKMNDLLKRFRDHALAMFEKYDIKPVAFFTPVIAQSNNQLIFILEFRDLAHREASFNAFMADAEWQKILAESNANGQILSSIENKILAPTDFSPLK